jgi:urea transporter
VKANRATFFISVFGAAATAITWIALSHFMGDVFVLNGKSQSWAIPAFTSAFVLTTWFFMLGTKRFGHAIWPAGQPESLEKQMDPKTGLIAGSSNPQVQEFHWTAKEFMIATLKGVAQVTFVNNWKTGIFWVVGLTLAFQLPLIAEPNTPWWTNAYTANWNPFSPLYLAGVMALIGSAIGAAMGILTKLPPDEIRNGLHGFNQVLLMVGMTTFLPLTPQSFMLAIFGAVGITFVNAGLQKLLKTWGITPLTGPFVFVAWILMIAVSGMAFNVPAGVGWARPPPS